MGWSSPSDPFLQPTPPTGASHRTRGITALSAIFFYKLPADAGHEISGRKASEISSRKGAEKAAVKSASENTANARDLRL